METKPEIVEIEGKFFIKQGEWLLDLFESGTPSLGITVYEPGTSPMDDTGKCVDIFVETDMSVKSY